MTGFRRDSRSATGAAELVVIVVSVAGVLAAWERGAGALTVAGLLPLLAVVAQVGLHRRAAAGLAPAGGSPAHHALRRITPLLLALLPAALALRTFGVGGPLDPRSSADLWLGCGVYLIALLELAGVTAYRQLDGEQADVL